MILIDKGYSIIVDQPGYFSSDGLFFSGICQGSILCPVEGDFLRVNSQNAVCKCDFVILTCQTGRSDLICAGIAELHIIIRKYQIAVKGIRTE